MCQVLGSQQRTSPQSLFPSPGAKRRSQAMTAALKDLLPDLARQCGLLSWRTRISKQRSEGKVGVNEGAQGAEEEGTTEGP